jgi:cell division septation protein DedD
VGAGLLDRLIRGPGWILCIGALLVGVVFFNVSLLELNRGITANSDHAAELRRANAELRLTVAKLASSERIQLAARQRGFVLPPPGEVRYLRASRLRDARLAARRIAPPSGQAVPPPAPAPVQQQSPAPVQPQPAAPVPAQQQPPPAQQEPPPAQQPATAAQPTPAQATGGQ